MLNAHGIYQCSASSSIPSTVPRSRQHSMALRKALAGTVLAAALLIAGVGRDRLAVLSSTGVQGRCAWGSSAARASILP